MKFIPGVFITGFILAALFSCRSVKTIQTAIAKKDTTQIVVPVVDTRNDSLQFIRKVLDSLQRNHIEFQTFSSKTKVHYEDNDGKNDFTAYIRLIKDSVLWINIRGPFDLDVSRALVTRDSVKVVDKLKKTVCLWPIDHLQELAHIPLTFSDLQNVLIGNPVFFDSSVGTYKIDDRSVSLVCIGAVFKHFLTVNKNDYTLQHSKLDDIDMNRARTVDITFGDYQYGKSGIRFSTYRRVTVSERSKLDIELDFKQVEFNKPLSISFSLPRNYKRL
ncbi:hypothetical protein A3860_09890 [Niastella vici]|uniref:DUF4292 domain-containing protein n=1 Tax=Niastella vici TaxID=1703345 RepID=A0A1V9FEU9_9BACT|nr:DUF4292 domain-containing protein [Niastella vici]OQP56884.1 hypothetical protein A3860_09890 [Niastella vici]